MKKISLIKGLALSVSALMAFSLSGCDFIADFLPGSDTSKPAVTISQTEVSLAVGDTVLLSATSTDGAAITWESLAPAVATVEEGLVTGIAEGETIVMASTAAVMATCTVKVNKATDTSGGNTDETLVLSHTSLSLEAGKTATLTATCSIAGATVKWASTNTTVATVTNGTINAKTAGKTNITASVALSTGGNLTASCALTVTPKTSTGLPEGSAKPGYELIWYDEFEGSSLDTQKWGYQTGTQDKYDDSPEYWGNGELQYYTQDAVSVSNGSLKITATKQQMGDRPYTSGRILTRDKQSWTYGYFEAKMKTPTGNGMWPAFWMLPQPTNSAVSSGNAYGTWPLNGEIDIMEAKGRLANVIDNTIHYGAYWPANQYTTNAPGGYTLKSGNTANSWHTYAVDWTADYIRWYVDGVKSFEVSKYEWWTDGSSGESAPFDKPFYILLNLAVGGGYDGGLAPEETFSSKTMEVDYVRVYKHV